MYIKSIENNIKKIQGKTVLLRVDFNVPVKNNKILDDQKIISSLPTIRFLIRYKCKVIIATHLGRPGGKIIPENSTKILAKRLGRLLGERTKRNTKVKKFNNIKFIEKFDEKLIKSEIKEMENGEILFLENLRFNAGEKKNSKIFAKKLASIADVYVNNAFSVSHRSHASVDAIKNYIPSFAGILLSEEVSKLSRILTPKKPLVVVIGGSKIRTKINLIQKLKNQSYKILIGGALANNFLKVLGFEIGKSLVDEESLKIAKKIIGNINIKYGGIKNKLVLPIDVIVTDKKTKNGKIKHKKITNVNKNEIISDIGPETIKLYSKHIKKANTIIWNGPLGRFEKKAFNHGTSTMAMIIGARSTGHAFGVAGGGETLEALKQSKMIDYMDWVSTGGGAMLTFLEKGKMPGLKGIVK